MSIEETNKEQGNSLRTLRDAIERRKKFVDTATPIMIGAMAYSEVPTINYESSSEHNPIRYKELCILVDVLYFNWKLSVQKNEDPESRLKELTKWVDEWMFESIKPRFS